MSFFSLLPPEINSGLIYAGPGASSMTAAATAWNGLAEELSSTAGSVSHVVSGLGSSWTGGSAGVMASATAPYIGWLGEASVLAGQLGTQATAQAGFYQAAHAAVISPALIVANRAQLLMLVATNFFGQNTPAIMANEAQYQGYWAVDSAAMDSYWSETQANVASMQQPSSPPLAAKSQAAPPSLNAGDPTGPGTGTGTGTGTTPAPTWTDVLGDLTSGNLSAAGTDLMGMLGTTGGASAFQAIYYPAMLASLPARVLPSLLMQMARMGSMGAGGMAGAGAAGASAAASGPTALMTQIGEFVDGKLQGAVGTLVGHFTSATHDISAKLGQAASMGALKVPQAWSMAADGMMRAAPVLPHTTVSAPAPAASASGLPGGPFGNALMGAMAGRGMGSVAAKAPKVIPRSPAGG